jgi:ABC-type multidrug transport system fused ATPase/permease subunit
MHMISLLRRLWRHINPRRRLQFVLLSALMVISSFSEVLSIGAVLPFLGVLIAPERIFTYSSMQPIIQLLGFTDPKQLLMPLTFIFCIATLIAAMMRLLLLWASTRLSFATGADLSAGIYRRTLYQPYAVQCARNSSEVINGISAKSNSVIYSTIMPLLMLLSSGVMLIVILLTLLAVEPLIAISTFGGFGLIYLLVVRLTRKKLRLNSYQIAHESNQVIKLIQEGLGGIRDVLLDRTQEVYCETYRRSDSRLRFAQGSIAFISSSPRYVMEALGMVLIAILAYYLSQQIDGVAKTIPILGALALGAQRLLPALQQSYSSWSVIQGSRSSLEDALNLLDQPLPDMVEKESIQPIPFQNSICLKGIGFRYGHDSSYVIRNVTLSVKKGSCIGFIGPTGSGKSTLLDLVMGLLEPVEGVIEVDGSSITQKNLNSWQKNIAHVPQSIFLADASIATNIALGVPKNEIDYQLLQQAARRAQLLETIAMMPKGFDTLVGERGVRLSGGQRQRIGIARALYKQAKVVVFDEATSALDGDTENAVMDAINGMTDDITILIIAHRLTTLKNCDQIIELGANGIVNIKTYKDIVSSCA